MIDFSREDVETPVGTVYLLSAGDALVALDYEGYEERMYRLLDRYWGPHTIHAGVGRTESHRRIGEYFLGDLAVVERIVTALRGSPFQNMVWEQLRGIPAGQTRSYGQLAAELGKPNGARAVGAANALNPIAIVHPCHRVVGAGSQLTGYAGGLERKRWLLEHEGAYSVSGSGRLFG